MHKFYQMISATALGLAPALSTAVPIAFFDFNGDGLSDTSWTVNQGETFTVDIYVGNVDSTHSGLLSWGTGLDFTQSLIMANSYSINSTWPLQGINNLIDNTAGKAELLGSAFFGSTGTMALFSIEFTATAAGLGSLSLQELYPANAAFTGFAGADGYDYDAEMIYGSASLNVNPVPLPASLWLFASGLLVLTARSRNSHRC